MILAAPISRELVLKVANTLPGAPKALADLQESLKNPNTDLGVVTALLRRDAALASRVLRIANGVVYNRGEPVGSIEEALSRVGFGEVFRLTGTASMLQMTDVVMRFYPISRQTLRENTLFIALLMEELSGEAGLDSRTAYLTGMLRSVGCVLLDLTAQRHLRIYRVPPLPEDGLLEWETALFGLTSPEIAAHVLRTWSFPVDVFVAIRDQFLHGLSVDPLPNAKLLHVCLAAAHGAGFPLPGAKFFTDQHAARARADLALKDERMASAVARTTVRLERLKAMLH